MTTNFLPLNPRVALWLKAIGKDEKLIERDTYEDTARIDGLPWNHAYSKWILSKWAEWCTGLGYRHRHDAALNGHTTEEFDAWLHNNVKGDHSA